MVPKKALGLLSMPAVFLWLVTAGLAWGDSQQQMTQVRFSVETPQGTYTDALYYPVDAVPPQPTIDAAIAARVKAWQLVLANPPPVERPPLDVLQEQLVAIQAAVVTVQTKVDYATNHMIDIEPPTIPQNLQATVGDFGVVLTWDPAVDDDEMKGYNVLRDGAIIGSVGKEAYTDFTVEPSTSYTYTVQGFDQHDNLGRESSPVTIDTSGMLQPQEPAGKGGK